MAHSHHGIVKDDKGQEQPVDKQRAQTAHKTATSAHKTATSKSQAREATRDPKLSDPGKTPGSGMASDDGDEPPTG